ncbi:MAG TPA: class I SAM-dependent RNA methyltransferase [Mycobacteriales bacterium]|jgi:tRNA/tmRNA/rRNA uracil-C5-methylase (TrmA/RlmC/RlmD family)|nr:class I SAM-dependent RNA methyltransferase [Mycobacteriales bacterium]
MGREVVVEAGGPLRHGGCAVTVDGRRGTLRHALPGERVRALVTSEEPLRLDAVEVLAASPDRVEEPCPYAKPGRCGGCDWQHAALPAQRALKSRVVSDLLGRDVTVEPVPVPGRPDDGLAWRTRVQFDTTPDGRLGLHRHRSAEVQPLDRCLIASDGVESVGAEALAWPVADRVEVVAGSSGDRAVVVTPRRRGGRVGAAVAPDVSVLRGDGRGGAEPVRGRPGVREHAAGRTWWVSGSGFWQSHVAAPDVLVAAVLDALAPEAGDLALDLYAGVGLFAGALAPRVRRVVAVESFAPAVDDARQNLRDLPSVEVHAGRVDAVLDRLGLGRADLVVLDPPRDGAGAAVMAQVAALAPRRVAYVSCDAAALARDLRAVEGAYAPREVRAFDLFPMTAHVECVALLEPVR